MCTNPDAVIKSVQAVRDRTHILMGGVNKGLDFAPLRHYLANHRHRVYLYGQNGEELKQALGSAGPVFETMQDAFKAAAETATKGEVIMLAPGCASTDAFKDFRDRGNVFKAIATDWLRL
jgi:UDP-N-acetylmuramoylalanine--D-glutamate ligase